jgi:eukaryotic-like serine/threonine-protein kinase
MLGDELLPVPGRFIGGKYRVVRVIARSPRAAVVEAEPATGEQNVAIKVIWAEAVSAAGGVKEVLQQARAFTQLNHANAVQIRDFGPLDDGSVYLAMRMLAGADLRTQLEAQAMPADAAIPMLSVLAEAIAAAHRIGVFHHALTPDSVLVTERGPQIIGFVAGKAKALSQGAHTLYVEKLGQMASIYPFVAPELLLGERAAGVLADIYSIGALAYFSLTGTPPYDVKNPLDLALMMRRFTPRRVDEQNAAVGKPLADIVERAMERDPSKRYQSAGELAEALRGQATGAAIGTPGRAPAASAPWRSVGRVAREATSEPRRVEIHRSEIFGDDDEPVHLPTTRRPAAIASVAMVLLAVLAWTVFATEGPSMHGATAPAATAAHTASALPKVIQAPPDDPKAAPAAEPDSRTVAPPSNDDWKTPPTPGASTHLPTAALRPKPKKVVPPAVNRVYVYQPPAEKADLVPRMTADSF